MAQGTRSVSIDGWKDGGMDGGMDEGSVCPQSLCLEPSITLELPVSCQLPN